MFRKSIILAATLTLALGAFGADAFAKPCRDASGKFMKCPPPAAAPANNHCRDIKTKKFAKCSVPGTEPVPMKSK